MPLGSPVDEYYYDEEYTGVEAIEVPDTVCRSPAVGEVIVGLADVTAKALSLGVSIIVDYEPRMYESVTRLAYIVSACHNMFWKTAVTLSDPSGRQKLFTITVNSLPRRELNSVILVIVTDSVDDNVKKVIREHAEGSKDFVVMFLTRGRPVFQAALYYEQLIPRLLERGFRKAGEEDRVKYLGKLPYVAVLLNPLGELSKLSGFWRPPPPGKASYLEEGVGFDDLVLPGHVADRVKRVLDIVDTGEWPSVMLLGLTGAGRKSIAHAVARRLGVPGFRVSLTGLLSRWVGESEQNIREIFGGARALGACVLVVEDVDILSARRNDSSGVASSMLITLVQEMSQHNPFLTVLTASYRAGPEILDSPVLGEIKFTVPPPAGEERWRVVRMFLSKLVDAAGGERVRRVLEREFGDADRFLDGYAAQISYVTAGLTPGEILRVMKVYVLPELIRLARDGKANLSRALVEIKHRDYAGRAAALSQLRDKAREIGDMDSVAYINRVLEEVRRLAMETGGVREE